MPSNLGNTWAEKYLPAIKKVIGTVAGKIITIEIASDEDDQQHATDYRVVVEAGRIAVRIRRNYSWRQYGDVTIRTRAARGGKTELPKLQEGFGDWYLYAWAVPEPEIAFVAWVFIDIAKLRSSGLLDELAKEPGRWTENFNGTPFSQPTAFGSISLAALSQRDCLVDYGGEAARQLFLF